MSLRYVLLAWLLLSLLLRRPHWLVVQPELPRDLVGSFLFHDFRAFPRDRFFLIRWLREAFSLHQDLLICERVQLLLLAALLPAADLISITS